jgi:hypothetical protein
MLKGCPTFPSSVEANITGSLNTSLLDTSCVLLIQMIKPLLCNFLLNSMHINVSNRIGAIESTQDLLECGSHGLRVDEVHPDEFDGNPELRSLSVVFAIADFIGGGTSGIEENQVPVLRKIFPRHGVGLATHSQYSLDCDVHNGEALGTQNDYIDIVKGLPEV